MKKHKYRYEDLKYMYRYETVPEQIVKCITMVVIGAAIMGFGAFLCYMDKGFVLGTVFMLICLVLWCVVCIAATVLNVKQTLKRQRQRQAQKNAGNNPQRRTDYFDGSGQIRLVRPRKRVLSKEALKFNIRVAVIITGISSLFMVPAIITGRSVIPRGFAIAWMVASGIAIARDIIRLRMYDRYELHDVDDYELYDDTESHLTNDEQQVGRTTCPYCGKEVLSTYLFCDGCDKELP